jgi:hypothetical protein
LPHARKRRTIDGHTRELADFMGKHRRLIEAPRPEPPRIEGHRHDEIGIIEEFCTGLVQPAAEQ